MFHFFQEKNINKSSPHFNACYNFEEKMSNLGGEHHGQLTHKFNAECYFSL